MDQSCKLSPDNTEFVLLSLEGPDRYSMAGGLGTRVSELSSTLANQGYRTHLFFVGDPTVPGLEARCGGNLVLHRWCQWISAYHPHGVYDGEEGKLFDFNRSLPRHVVEEIIVPAIEQGKVAVVMAEEWQTAEALCAISDLLHGKALRPRALLLWNTNNTTGFERIDWLRLTFVANITTVSRYMKHRLADRGVQSMVIPNGIPRRLIGELDQRTVGAMRRAMGRDLSFFKMARWDPAKGWEQAVKATAILKAAGVRPLLQVRGGMESYGSEIMSTAGSLGLRVASLELESQEPVEYIQAIRQLPEADVVELKSFVTEPLARYLYASADGVLANSVHEPFGLVGLEAMAVGGVAYTGSTGEDYAIAMENAVVLETQDPEEIVGYALCLREQPELKRSISEGAKRTARHHTWEKVVGSLLGTVEYLAQRQGLPLPTASPCAPGCACGDPSPALALKPEDQVYAPSTPGRDGLSLLPSLAASQGNLLTWRKRPVGGAPWDSPA